MISRRWSRTSASSATVITSYSIHYTKLYDSVEKYTGYAREDYRNILAWAEYPRQAREWVMPDADEKQKMIEADLTEYENWLHDN